MEEEKEYVYFIHGRTAEGADGIERVVIKESELTQGIINLYTGELIMTFNKAPEQSKMEFLQRIMQEMQEQSNRKLYNEFKGFDIK